MSLLEQLEGRFLELVSQGDSIASSKRSSTPHRNVIPTVSVDHGRARVWTMSVLALIRSTFGVDSDYYTEVQRCLHKCFVYDHFLVIYSSLQSALDALRNGYLFDSRQLLEADVAADYLEQASQLHVAGYKDAAAVISGSVLERHLRNMCNARGISLFKPSGKPKTINDLNDELGKSAVLNTLKRKQITSWADIRNNAAHGNYDKYLATDVEAMIRDVGVFCADFS